MSNVIQASWTPNNIEESKPRVNRISHSEKRKGYRYKDKSPELYEILYLIRVSGKTFGQISKETGITLQTFISWDEGKTYCPNASSIRMVKRCLGIVHKIFGPDGQEIVVPGMNEMYAEFADAQINYKLNPPKRAKRA